MGIQGRNLNFALPSHQEQILLIGVVVGPYGPLDERSGLGIRRGDLWAIPRVVDPLEWVPSRPSSRCPEGREAGVADFWAECRHAPVGPPGPADQRSDPFNW